MAELGERIAGLEARMEHIEHIVDGNGQPGLNKVTRDFISEWRGANDERTKHEKQRDNRLAIILTIIGLILTYLTLRVEMKKEVSFIPPAISQSSPQDAGRTY